jgi:hypothetical protein
VYASDEEDAFLNKKNVCIKQKGRIYNTLVQRQAIHMVISRNKRSWSIPPAICIAICIPVGRLK